MCKSLKGATYQISSVALIDSDWLFSLGFLSMIKSIS